MRPAPQPIAGASGMTAAPPPAAGAVGLGTRSQQTKFSQMVLEALSAFRLTQRPTHTTSEHRNRRAGEESNDCQGNNCLLTSLPVKQPEELTTTSVTNNDERRTTTADSDSSTAVFYTTSHPLRIIVSYACCCCFGSGYVCMKWCVLNINEGRRELNCFCDEYWLHFPWTSNPRGVRGSPFLLLLCFCAAVCAATILVCVCVPSVRAAGTTDRSRRVCMRWSLVCRSCLLLPLPSVCCCCGRAVWLLTWIGVCVVCGVRRTVHAWLLPSPHVVCPLCVSAAPLVSPVALHAPHCTDQLHTTERPHSR
ncbi:hypothetical protein TCDM_10906 [Trypanosoma cruzi Dm28c]|uniref:Mucin TcMUCII n=1 Tax=Trypanosoma cruzi Dm28c TaxID=1416333 RepID=V5D210_TRYCR|nr:hypothetical protein TCDM_10906 [Trypanosoma cruzi Dm28c]